MIRNVINFILFQAGWFACILGAANGRPWFGVVAVPIIAVVHFAFISGNRRGDALTLVIAAILGYILDSMMVLAGAMTFPENAALGAPSTLWMVALWANFALTLDASLAWLRDRYFLSAIFGIIGGPLAYWTGARFGAIELGSNLWLSLTAIGVEWMIAMPVLALIAVRIHASQKVNSSNAPATKLNAETSAETNPC